MISWWREVEVVCSLRPRNDASCNSSLCPGQAMLSSLLKVAQTSAPMYNGGSGLKAEPLRARQQTQEGVLESLVESVLEFDRKTSRQLCLSGREWVRWACLLLEWSGHGVLWFLLCGLLFLLHLLSSNPLYLTHAWDVLVLLVVDIVAVAPVKLLFKRPRPPANPGAILLSVSSVDIYSFPSGHASRAVALAAHFSCSPPVRLGWTSWALLVCLSRVVSGRHYLLDVLAGVAAGLTLFWSSRLLGLLYL